ncbi:MAG: apolipoprotein N-acyltransferase [Deltaproteobacteria bacterium]|nr:apolipoprotein N-acyltransferase [Deltaproteobacteria bacterium]
MRAPPASRAERIAAKRRRRWERHVATVLPWRDQLARLGWGTLAGVCIFLSFPFQTEPDTNLWPLAWVGLVPFLWALRSRADGRALTGAQGFSIGAWVGFVTNLGGFWWVSEVLFNFGHLPWFVSWPLTALNAFYQGLMWAFVGLWWVKAQARAPGGAVPIWKVAAIFTVVEWLFPMIFPWYLANGQYRFLPVIQIAELGGVMAVTFLMVAFNAALFAIVDHRARGTALPRRAAIVTFAITALVIGWGALRVGQVDADIAAAEKFKIGLVEADIGIFEKQAKHLPPREQALTLHKNLLRHQRMSAELEAQGVDLVVWPESSYFPLDDPFVKRLDEFAMGVTDAGALVVGRDTGAGQGLEWAASRVEAPVPGLTAITALREDEWAAVGRGGALVVSGKAVQSGTREDLHAVAMIEQPGFSRGEDGVPFEVWAVGDGGAVIQWKDGRAEALASGVTTPLRAIALGAGRTGWIVGDGGVVLRLDQGRLTRLDAGTTADLRAVWIDPAGGGALVAGAAGALVFLDHAGRAASQSLPGPVPPSIVALAADRDGVVYAAGPDGVFARRADRWTREPEPSPTGVVALATDARGNLLASTALGAIWQRTLVGTGSGPAAPRWDAAMPVHTRVVSLTPLPYVQVRPLPRDVRHVYQGHAPLPQGPIDEVDPMVDIQTVSIADRSAIQRGFSAPILLGALTWEIPPPESESRRRILYNTAVLLDEEGRVRGTYDKVFLLAFGEFMPFGETFPWLYDAFPNAGRFTAGTEVKAFQWRGKTLGVMVCYEDIMAGFTSKLADLDPHIIINVTNDAWFGRTSEPYLHLALSIFRAVENRRMLVRSTNTGVSALIDPTGRIVAQTRIDHPEVVVRDVPFMQGTTVYAAVGDLFVSLVLLMLVIEGALAWWSRRTPSPSPGAPPI